MDALHRQIAETIRGLAEEKGIPISHLPDHAGVGRSHFWTVLQGAASPTVKWLESIAEALGVQAWELLHQPKETRHRVKTVGR